MSEEFTQKPSGPARMTMEGYVLFWRKALESGWLKNHKLWAFWSWCLLKASWKPHKTQVGYREVELQPGQLIFGRKKAAEELGMSEQNIRTCLDTLRKRENLTIETTNKFSIITICNWDTYQNINSHSNQQSNQELTNNSPTTNHKQESNKEKKEKKEDNTSCSDTEKAVSKRPLNFSDDDLRLANLLSNLMTKNNPSRKPTSQTQLKSWANDCRLMRERDNRSVESIEAVLRWSQQDSFWMHNIYSMGKLREKYDRLFGKMKDNGKNKNTATDTTEQYPWPEDVSFGEE